MRASYEGDLLQNVINATTDPIFYKDLKYRYIGCNDAFSEFVGIAKEKIIGRTDYQLFPKKYADKFRATDKEVIEAGLTKHHEKWVRYPDGREVYQHTTKSPLRDAQGKIFGLMGISRDMTVQKRLKDELKDQHAYVKTILDSLDNLIFITSDGVEVIDANKAFLSFFQSSTCKIIGTKNGSIALKKKGFIEILTSKSWLSLIINNPETLFKTILIHPQSGENRIFSIKVTALGQMRHHWLVVLNDVTDIESERLYFEEKSKIDGLTQAYNRATILEFLHREIELAKIGKHKPCALMIDIDHFKTINDVYGHLAGDKILKEVAALIRANIRKDDLLGRYGGEEFLAILGCHGMQAAEKIAEKLRRVIEKNVFEYEGITIPVTVSIGVSMWHESDDEKSLLQRADDALYHSKRSGRNRVSAISLAI
ncbi:MAG: diguanylate cyclase [Campylobacterales bacterium]